MNLRQRDLNITENVAKAEITRNYWKKYKFKKIKFLLRFKYKKVRPNLIHRRGKLLVVVVRFEYIITASLIRYNGTSAS